MEQFNLDSIKDAINSKTEINERDKGKLEGILLEQGKELTKLYKEKRISDTAFIELQKMLLDVIKNQNTFNNLKVGFENAVHKIKEDSKKERQSVLVDFTKDIVYGICRLDKEHSKNSASGNYIMGMIDSLFTMPEFMELIISNSEFRSQAWEALKNINIDTLTDEVKRLMHDTTGEDPYKMGRAHVDVILTLTGIAGIAKGLGKVLTKGGIKSVGKGIEIASQEGANNLQKITGRTIQGVGKVAEYTGKATTKVGAVADLPMEGIRMSGRGIKSGMNTVMDSSAGIKTASTIKNVGNQGVILGKKALESGKEVGKRSGEMMSKIGKDLAERPMAAVKTIKQKVNNLKTSRQEMRNAQLREIENKLLSLEAQKKEFIKTQAARESAYKNAQESLDKFMQLTEKKKQLKRQIMNEGKIRKEFDGTTQKLDKVKAEIDELTKKKTRSPEQKERLENLRAYKDDLVKISKKKETELRDIDSAKKSITSIEQQLTGMDKKSIQKSVQNAEKELATIEKIMKEHEKKMGNLKTKLDKGKVASSELSQQQGNTPKKQQGNTPKKQQGREDISNPTTQLKENIQMNEAKIQALEIELQSERIKLSKLKNPNTPNYIKIQEKITKLSTDITASKADLRGLQKELSNMSILPQVARVAGGGIIANNLVEHYDIDVAQPQWNEKDGNGINTGSASNQNTSEIEEEIIPSRTKGLEWRDNITDEFRAGVSKHFIESHSKEIQDIITFLTDNSKMDPQFNFILSALEVPSMDNILTLQDLVLNDKTDQKTGKDGMLGINTLNATINYIKKKIPSQESNEETT